ncbi:dimethylallyltransferase [Sphaerisporangium krabiense]|uniref:Geranylgeranyl diphosphate synthase type I n=1 Tax=Sphaerisporangium krabiense TaxID=763782 RepID=A0A7W9DR28_9ACTN|nr:family 2 encapsulin nanocompartment cargo protein polyprenyl transferase [Sphaerisporangium krabiense]MBB5628192.1 geranylgeranyl diphosphate synthase type I [Sphaerisporangium krabiense]GII62362.1 dimethylallyltransferase [Sphaerisporangium krabiense]
MVEVTTTGRQAHEVLAWSRDQAGPALRGAVESLPPSMRSVAGYHFGWLDRHGAAAVGGGGKAVRPALALLSAEAVGADAGTAVPAAVAVELVHNFSLLHDDVMDGDLTRRHRATAWSLFGVSPAILAGDALLALAFDVLAASGHPAAPEGGRLLGATVLDLIDGQGADTSFETRGDVSLQECLSMAESKTGALLGASCALGALFGGAAPERVERLRAFGDRLGLAFQFVDDLLGIWGDPAVTGKPIHSDLRNRKKSLPVVAALSSGSPAGDELAALYGREEPPAGPDLVRAAELIELAGGRAWSTQQAGELLREALGHLAAASPTPGAATELRALAHLITHRDH